MFVTFDKHECIIYDKSDQIVARGVRDNGLYKFEGITANEHACVALLIGSKRLFRLGLGHGYSNKGYRSKKIE